MITDTMNYQEWLEANDLVDTELNMVRYNEAIDAVTVINGFTVTELRRAFDEVADKDDWKAPIDAWIEDHDYNLVLEAIDFMTATMIKVVDTKIESEVTTLRITSVGYRNGPAGP